MEQDITQAIRWYRLAAEYGDEEAAERTGELEEYLEKVEQWRLAAEEGDVEAMYRLAEAYDLGMCVKYDLEKAILWYTLAAEQGHYMSEWCLEKLKCLMVDNI